MIKIPLNLVRDIINLDFACALKKNKKSPKRMFSPCEEWQEAACETSEGNVQAKENHFHFLMITLRGGGGANKKMLRMIFVH